MKKLMALLICALMFVALTACGGSKTSSSNKNEVTLWVHTSNNTAEGKAMQKTVDNFNEKFDGKYSAKIEFIPRSGSGGGYEDKINAALTTDTLPDVLTLDGPNTAAYAKSGIIAPVGQYITNKDDLLPSIVEQGTYNGKLYAVGYSESGVGIFYNKKMLKDAGVDLSTLPTVDDPWDWNQFMDLCQTLVDKYNRPAIDMQFNDKSEWLMYAFTPFLWSQGGQVVNDKGTKSTGVFNNEDGVKTMSFIQEMVKKGYTTNTPVKKGFQTGKYPMLLSGSWTIQEMKNKYKDVDFGIMPYPTSPDTHKLVSPSGSWQYAMSATTKKKEAAGALVNFMTSTKAMTRVSLANSVLPARESVIEEIKNKVSPQMNVLIEQNRKTAHARPVLPEYPRISHIFQQTISAVTYYKENKDIQKLLNEKAKLMDEVLEK